MTEVNSRDMHRMTNIVDARWAAGSGIDVLLLTDPFVHALANRIPDLCPDMRPSKTSMREAVLECHVGENGPCLFHLGSACAVATQVAERIRKVCSKCRFLKREAARLNQVCTRSGPVERERILTVTSKIAAWPEKIPK